MDVEAETRRVTAVLSARHPLFAPRTVERLVRRIFAEFADAPVRTFVPVLVQRRADERLRDLDHDYAGVARRVVVLPDAGVSVEA
ncbi:MAG: three-helix bundle dimerization domain-containing protein [Kineosporiaceae bacterium]|jgi:hypothetical protein